MAYAYDPSGRLAQSTVGGAITRFLYDGATLIAELDASGAVLRRYVRDAGVSSPLVWYEGASVADRRWLMADERGTIVATASASGQRTALNTFEEYGVGPTGNTGRFQFGGQAYLPEVRLYHYKARVYDPILGRFLQTDPIGYEDNFNLYAYVGNDPVNATDPSGEERFGIFGNFEIGWKADARIQVEAAYDTETGEVSLSARVGTGLGARLTLEAGGFAEPSRPAQGFSASAGLHGQVSGEVGLRPVPGRAEASADVELIGGTASSRNGLSGRVMEPSATVSGSLGPVSAELPGPRGEAAVGVSAGASGTVDVRVELTAPLPRLPNNDEPRKRVGQ